MEELARNVIRGDRLSLSKALSLVENNESEGLELISRLVQKIGNSFVIGITGPPGVGKSTLISKLIEEYRRKGLRVGVIAIDPSSPLSGGAFLGDRIRMVEHTLDKGVYIRSMASRGWLGGLSASAAKAVCVLDSAGIDVILVETVGVGQTDVEVTHISDIVVVVLMPNIGDVIQLSKAGLLEVGDLFVVNKSDIEGTNIFVSSLYSALKEPWKHRPIFSVSSVSGEGVKELFLELEERRKRFLSAGREDIRIRIVSSLLQLVARKKILEKFNKKLHSDRHVTLAKKTIEGEITFIEAVDRLID